MCIRESRKTTLRTDEDGIMVPKIRNFYLFAEIFTPNDKFLCALNIFPCRQNMEIWYTFVLL